MSKITIQKLSAHELKKHIDDFALVLQEVVLDGGSVNFIAPFSLTEATNFWTQKIHPALLKNEKTLWAAFIESKLAGTVQLDHSMPPNQQHRCEVSKLLVSPRFRRRGIARKLMHELEKEAAKINRPLITLDTVKGSNAEPLYLSLGFEIAGIIPRFSRHPVEDHFDATTYMFKQL